MSTRNLIALTMMLGLAACAETPKVHAVTDHAANFSQYQTFGFEVPLGTDQGGYRSILSSTLKAATQRQMEARGLRYDAANPQLLINFNAKLTDQLRVTTTSTPTYTTGIGYGRGYYGYRTGMYSTWTSYHDQTTVTPYKEGTINIDVADAARKQLVWEAVVSSTVTQKTLDNIGTAVDSAVASAFTKFPVKGPAAK
jgi:hypothetical protein